MPLRDVLLNILLTALLPVAVGAGPLGQGRDESPNATQLERQIELRAHRALEMVRNRPGVTLASFTTDGCSGGMSRVWSLVADIFPDIAKSHRARPPWEACCVTHDHAYHAAGPDSDPERSFESRLQADEALRKCVFATADDHSDGFGTQYGMTSERMRATYSAIAEAMYLSVRLGGGPCTGLPWRWGYGYPHCGVLQDWTR